MLGLGTPSASSSASAGSAARVREESAADATAVAGAVERAVAADVRGSSAERARDAGTRASAEATTRITDVGDEEPPIVDLRRRPERDGALRHGLTVERRDRGTRSGAMATTEAISMFFVWRVGRSGRRTRDWPSGGDIARTHRASQSWRSEDDASEWRDARAGATWHPFKQKNRRGVPGHGVGHTERARAPCGRHARRDVAHPRGDARGGALDRARRLASVRWTTPWRRRATRGVASSTASPRRGRLSAATSRRVARRSPSAPRSSRLATPPSRNNFARPRLPARWPRRSRARRAPNSKRRGTTSTRDATRCAPSSRCGRESSVQVSQAHGARRTRPRARQGASQHRRFRRGDAAHPGRRHHTPPPVARYPADDGARDGDGYVARGTRTLALSAVARSRTRSRPSPPPPRKNESDRHIPRRAWRTSRQARGWTSRRDRDPRRVRSRRPDGDERAGAGRWEMNRRFERTGWV